MFLDQLSLAEMFTSMTRKLNILIVIYRETETFDLHICKGTLSVRYYLYSDSISVSYFLYPDSISVSYFLYQDSISVR